jgi:hypothetical protein
MIGQIWTNLFLSDQEDLSSRKSATLSTRTLDIYACTQRLEHLVGGCINESVALAMGSVAVSGSLALCHCFFFFRGGSGA